MRRLRNVIGFLFVVLYLCHHISCNYFYHTHYLADTKVSHSHPYIPSGTTAEHTHTAGQFTLINAIDSQEFFGAELAAVPALLRVLLLTILVCTYQSRYQAHQFCIGGRSPPSC